MYYTTDDVMGMFGVSRSAVSAWGKKIGKVSTKGKPLEWTDEDLEKLSSVARPKEDKVEVFYSIRYLDGRYLIQEEHFKTLDDARMIPLKTGDGVLIYLLPTLRDAEHYLNLCRQALSAVKPVRH